MARRRAALEDDAAAEALVAREPALLGADIAALLAEVRAAPETRATHGAARRVPAHAAGRARACRRSVLPARALHSLPWEAMSSRAHCAQLLEPLACLRAAAAACRAASLRAGPTIPCAVPRARCGGWCPARTPRASSPPAPAPC